MKTSAICKLISKVAEIVKKYKILECIKKKTIKVSISEETLKISFTASKDVLFCIEEDFQSISRMGYKVEENVSSKQKNWNKIEFIISAIEE